MPKIICTEIKRERKGGRVVSEWKAESEDDMYVFVFAESQLAAVGLLVVNNPKIFGTETIFEFLPERQEAKP